MDHAKNEVVSSLTYHDETVTVQFNTSDKQEYLQKQFRLGNIKTSS